MLEFDRKFPKIVVKDIVYQLKDTDELIKGNSKEGK